LTVEGAPAGLVATFTPASVPGDAITSTLTLTPDTSVAPKTYALTVRATGTGVSDATASFSVVVTPAPKPTLTLALNPTAPTVVQGSSATVNATIARGGGFTGVVGLTVTGAPDGLTAAFVPLSIASGLSTSMLTLVASATVKPGTYSLTVTATGSGVSDATGALTVTVQKAVTPPPTTDVAAIVVTPDGGTVSSGSTLQLTAEVIDTTGNKLTGRPVTWATSNVSVTLLASTAGTSPSTVNVTAWRAGQATIAASSGGVVKYVTVTVTAGRPAQLSVQPVAAQIETGQTIQLAASAVDAAGNVVPGPGPIAWSSSDATVAAVDATGVVRGAGAGTATISAKLGTLSASAFISVVAVGVLPGVQMIDLGTLGGSNSSALAINNLGQVVGASQLAGGANAVSHAFLWTAAGCMVDIATPSDTKTSSAA